MKPENSTLLNVCIIPDVQTSNRLIKASQTLKGDDTMFVLGEGLSPHMTVYMARFADEDISKVVAATESALKKATPFTCEHTGYLMAGGRYFEASYQKSEKLMKLHELLITHNANLRINPGSPFNEGYFGEYSADQQKNAQETGYDLARNLYRPHVTLTRYKEGGVPELAPLMPSDDLSFSPEKIGIYKADSNGSVYEMISEFKFA